MYHKKTLFLFLVFLYSLTCLGQSGKTINGVIVDKITGLPIQGAYIRTIGKKANTTSNGSGLFSITIPDNIASNDSLVIDALGYARKAFPISYSSTEPIQLNPIPVLLPNVTVASYRIDWNEFMRRIGESMRMGKLPVESEIQKTISVSTNLNPPQYYSFSGLSHSEGVTEETFTSYLRGSTFWYTVLSSVIKDTTSFKGCNPSGNPQVFTELERGKFQWLLKMYAIGSEIADYKIDSITQFGGDSVYVVKYLPKDWENNKEVKKLNAFSDNGMFSFFSLEKTFYVRKKDFKFLRIDYVQRPGNVTGSLKNHINSIHELSGSIGLDYFNDTPHPIYIYEKYLYQDINGNEIERNDSCYYSNIKMEKLNTDELKKKYQLKYIYRSFPIRDVQVAYQEKLGPFWNVPIFK